MVSTSSNGDHLLHTHIFSNYVTLTSTACVPIPVLLSVKASKMNTSGPCSQWPTTGSVGIVLVQEWPLSGPLQRAETQRMGLNLSTQLSSSKPSPAMEQAAWGGCWGCF